MNNPDALNVETHEDEMTERDTVCGRCGAAFTATTPAPPDNCGRPEGEACPKCYTADRAWAIGRALEIDQPNIAAALAHDLLVDLDPDDDRGLVSICKGIIADYDTWIRNGGFAPPGGAERRAELGERFDALRALLGESKKLKDAAALRQKDEMGRPTKEEINALRCWLPVAHTYTRDELAAWALVLLAEVDALTEERDTYDASANGCADDLHRALRERDEAQAALVRLREAGQGGVQAITEERARQIAKWGQGHDRQHRYAELAIAAAQLLTHGTDAKTDDPHETLAWGLVEKHGRDQRRRLAIAGALVAAEIDRVTDTAAAIYE